jgi:hypothetical protein
MLHIISTDEDPGLRIESFAVINVRGVSTNKTIICFIAMQTYKELITIIIDAVKLTPYLYSNMSKTYSTSDIIFSLAYHLFILALFYR